MEIRTEIEVAAPPAQVWQRLVDLQSYARWNPLITHIAGDLLEGARLSVTYSFADGSELRFVPHLIVVRPPQELRWRSRLWLRGILDSEHSLVLQPVPSGGTRVAQIEVVTGWALKYVGRRLTHTARGLIGMNEALKRLVEQGE